MIKNSYQIFNCKETNSSFKLLNELEEVDSTDTNVDNKAIYEKIANELRMYHDTSKLEILTDSASELQWISLLSTLKSCFTKKDRRDMSLDN